MNQVNRALLACVAVGLVSSLTPNILLAQPGIPPGAQPPNVNCGSTEQPCATRPQGGTSTSSPPQPTGGAAPPPTGQPPATSPVAPRAAPQRLQPPSGSAPPPGHYWCHTINQYIPQSRMCPRAGGSGVSAGG
jgi:hypothetical protein